MTSDRNVTGAGVSHDLGQSAAGAAPALEPSEDLKAHISALTRLHELAMQLAGPLDLKAALDAILRTIVDLHGADLGILSVFDSASSLLRPAASIGFDRDSLDLVSDITPGQDIGACGSTFATRTRVVILDTDTDPRFACFREAARKAGFRSVHSTPVLTRSGEILGVLSVHFAECRQPTELEMQLADMCARNAAEVIESSRSRDALHESERRYRQLLETLPAAVYMTDADGRLKLYNAAAVELWGREPRTGQDRWCGSLRMYMPDGTSLPLGRCPMAVALQEGRSLGPVEAVVERPDGTRRNVLAHPRVVRNSAGAVIGAINVLVDITERKKAQQELATLKEQLASELAGMRKLHEVSTRLLQQGDLQTLLAEVMEVAISLTGADMGNIQLLDASGALQIEAQRGFEPPFLKFFSNVHAGEATCGTAIERGERVVIEDVANSPIFAGTDALAVMLEAGARACQSTPLTTPSGRILGVFSTFYRKPRRPEDRDLPLLDLLARQAADLIERAQTEESLRAREEQERNRALEMQATMDAVPAAILIARDPECREVTGNRTGSELLNGAKYFRNAGDGVTIPERDLPVQKAAGSGQAIRNCEFDAEFADGSRRRLFGNAVPLVDEQGASRGAVGAFIDVTETRRVEERLRDAQKLESIGLLAGGIAHDFNNILVGVLGNASLAADMVPPDSQVLSLIKGIELAAERAAHLTRQMLAYAGKGQFVLQQVDLSEIARETVPLVQASISKKVSIYLELAQRLPTIEADRSQIQQVFMNLILNAAEAIGDRPGQIRIRTDAEAGVVSSADNALGTEVGPGPYVRIDVSDSGCGMDENTKARIFDPFFSTKFTGRGLGLSAAAGVIRGHSGAVKVRSVPGQGTTFTVMFPAFQGTQPAANSSAESPQEQVRGSGRILVVDDEEMVLATARRALERHGYQVVAAGGGEAAIEIFAHEAAHIDLVLLDLSMPGLSGHETLAELQKIDPQVKAVVSSGYSESEAFRHFSGQSVAGFLQKPYTATRLAEKVKSAMEEP